MTMLPKWLENEFKIENDRIIQMDMPVFSLKRNEIFLLSQTDPYHIQHAQKECLKIIRRSGYVLTNKPT